MSCPCVRVRVSGVSYWVEAWLAQMWLDMGASGVEVLSRVVSEAELRERVDAWRASR